MPELPDVETFRAYFESKALDRKIISVEADRQILDGTTEQELARALKGERFTGSRRHGKHLFAEMSSGRWLGFHFGMTGFFKYYQNPEDRPGHVRALVSFDNGFYLAFDCRRKLGRVRLVEDPDAFLTNRDIGPDAFSDEMSEAAFEKRLSGSRGAIKSVLMDQSVVSGIGNVYSDEILYQARIHPRRKANELSPSEVRQIYRAMRKVFEQAISARAEPEEMPENFLITLRGTGADCPCGGKLEKIRVSGRNGYCCPSCQK